jgi:hypothetical protein
MTDHSNIFIEEPKYEAIQFTRHVINDTDVFDERDFPEITFELLSLKQKVSGLEGQHKEEIIISYLKDHSIKTTWVETYPKLTAIMISSTLPVLHLEHLFESCRKNTAFLAAFENYIHRQLGEVVTKD